MSHPMPIRVYGRPDCEDTNMVCNRMMGMDIPFERINIDEDEEAARFVEEANSGFRSTPTLVFGDGGLMVTEPNEAELDEALRKSGHL